MNVMQYTLHKRQINISLKYRHGGKNSLTTIYAYNYHDDAEVTRFVCHFELYVTVNHYHW